MRVLIIPTVGQNMNKQPSIWLRRATSGALGLKCSDVDSGEKMAKKHRIKVNFIYQLAYQILLVILPLVTAPYIARVLGPENNGIYTYTHAIVNYFVVFAALGIEAYGNRLIAQSKNKDRQTLNKAFSSVFWMHFIVACAAALVYFVYVTVIASRYRQIAVIQGIWVLASIIDINWLFFGLEEFKLTVTRNTIIKLVTVFCIFAFVRTRDQLWLYTLIMGMGTFLSNAVLWGFARKYVLFTRVTFREIIVHFKPLVILFLAVIATSIYRMIDKVMLGWYSDMSNLGSYEYADRMIKLVITLITALGTVMLPRMSALYAEGKDEQAARYMNSTSQFMFVMAFALAFGLAGIADEFMPTLLGPGYEGSVILTKVLCISLPIMGWNNLVRTQVLMPKEKDRVYIVAVWAGAIVNIILNYLFIHWYGPIGAAIATVAAYAVVGVFQTYPLKKELPVASYLKYVFIPLISGVIMYVCVRAVSRVLKPGIAGIAVEILTGAVIYLAINLVYLMWSKNEVFEDVLQKYKKKLHK